MNYYPCPRCTRNAPLMAEHAEGIHKRHYFYKCPADACRCAFRVLAMEGHEPFVVARSPEPAKSGPRIPPPVKMGCPDCGVYGRIKTSEKREGEYWRRHQCPKCGPYWTCQTNDSVTVHKRLRSKLATDTKF